MLKPDGFPPGTQALKMKRIRKFHDWNYALRLAGLQEGIIACF
jgi:hypothetical protein